MERVKGYHGRNDRQSEENYPEVVPVAWLGQYQYCDGNEHDKGVYYCCCAESSGACCLDGA